MGFSDFLSICDKKYSYGESLWPVVLVQGSFRGSGCGLTAKDWQRLISLMEAEIS
jgi:hypothetical protein